MELHKKTQIEVQKLLYDSGHVLNLDDLSDIIELNDLANRVTGDTGAYASIHKWPVKCGKLLLRPLTVGKLAWYNQRGLIWFDDDIQTLSTVLAFLLSVDNDESFVWGLEDAETAKATIEAWEKEVDVTPAELGAAVDSVVNSYSSRSGDEDKVDRGDGPLIALLCREYGNTPQHWMYRESINVIRALVDEHVRKINSEITARNQRGKGKKVLPPIKTPSMDASLLFRKKLLTIAEKWGVKDVG